MIALGVLLILIAAGVAAVLATAPDATTPLIDLSAVGVTVSASPLALFIAGAVSVILIGLGLALINGGARRKASSRKELRDLRRGQAADTVPTSGATGQHSSRRDRPQNGNTGNSTGTTATGDDTKSSSGTDSTN
ncbi:MAG: hypothetical protein ABI474_07525 [Actinomycetota bacterium]